MFFSLCYVALRWMLQLAALRVRSNACKDLEIVLLRHELAILRRRTRRPAMTWTDRLLPRGSQPTPAAGTLAVPATLLRWHRRLVYRAFTRFDAGEVPDAKTILKIARVLGPEVIEQLHRQVIEVAKRAGVTHGRRFRTDTTVVETNAQACPRKLHISRSRI